ncbi:MAG: 30S ribosomal protein S16, partial [Candidatus Caldatribacterium sp.]|nr:30S ribosomal protein S16 [Candidatus Caldatribacterium sp.]
MAVRIRLMRVGRRHLPQYRIVATDSREARSGKPLEVLGNYSPLGEPELTSLKWDRIEYWIAQGAEVSAKVKALLRKAKKLKEVEAR